MSVSPGGSQSSRDGSVNYAHRDTFPVELGEVNDFHNEDITNEDSSDNEDDGPHRRSFRASYSMSSDHSHRIPNYTTTSRACGSALSTLSRSSANASRDYEVESTFSSQRPTSTLHYRHRPRHHTTRNQRTQTTSAPTARRSSFVHRPLAPTPPPLPSRSFRTSHIASHMTSSWRDDW